MDGRHGSAGDRRVRRTEGRLHGALAALLHEKAYDAIAVKEILARADVGRSTFYAHFPDKDALLLAGLREVLGAAGATPARGGEAADRVLRFARPLLRHVEQARGRHGSGGGVAARGPLHAHLRTLLAAWVEGELLERQPGTRGSVGRLPPALLAAHVADAFVRVLEWWAGHDAPIPADEAETLFRRLVRPAVVDALSA